MEPHTTRNNRKVDIPKDEWETLDEMYAAMNAVFSFDYDMAATPANAKASMWAEDTLTDTDFWPYGSLFCNPPFSKAGAFAEMAVRTVMYVRSTVVMVMRASNLETKHWKPILAHGRCRIGICVPRLWYAYEGEPFANVDFPSAVVVISPKFNVVPQVVRFEWQSVLDSPDDGAEAIVRTFL